ncbi:MAG: hypothetical protein U1E63_15880 [Burkholderiales bacterium]
MKLRSPAPHLSVATGALNARLAEMQRGLGLLDNATVIDIELEVQTLVVGVAALGQLLQKLPVAQLILLDLRMFLGCVVDDGIEVVEVRDELHDLAVSALLLSVRVLAEREREPVVVTGDDEPGAPPSGKLVEISVTWPSIALGVDAASP